MSRWCRGRPNVRRLCIHALGVCNALDCVGHFGNTNIDRDDFECTGDQLFAGYGALRGCVVAVKRSQLSGSRPSSFANMMRPPLFLHHAQLWTNPQHNSLVSLQPPHPSSNAPESAIWRPIRPITAPRTRPLTRRCQQRRYTESDRSASLEPVWPPDHYTWYVSRSLCPCDPIDAPRPL
jgi:hypothetical protein